MKAKKKLADENLSPEKDYKTISTETLAEIMPDKHFFLLDVHIPEQTHIKGTDEFIPYNQISANLDKLPTDKNDPIVVYCRSGGMSQQAAQTLVDLGYTNVYHLEGGIQAYNSLTQN
ncbi:rhodanese-like domain-containing protein [Candidatus Parcubacteria bacterium]|nr:MAG: rhodanese-like domain-containing protein [Candidatus Parcubacteria bacterium]